MFTPQGREQGGHGPGRRLLGQAELLHGAPPSEPDDGLLGLAEGGEQDAVLTHVGHQGWGGAGVEA